MESNEEKEPQSEYSAGEAPFDVNDIIWNLTKHAAELSPEKKKELIESMMSSCSKTLMLAFYSLGLQDGMWGKVINDPTGDTFEFSFRRIAKKTN